MAKKQQIILLHGSEKFTDKSLISKGELVIEHGAEAIDVKLHTLDNSGEIATFASQAYVDKQVENINGSINFANGRLDALEAEIDQEIKDRQDGDNAVRGEFAAADDVVRGEFAAADKALGERIDATNANVTELNGKLDVEVAAREAADAALQGNIDAEAGAREEADNKIREDFKAVDDAIKAMVGTPDEGKTVVQMVKDEASAREIAISGIQAQINALDDTYATDAELQAKVNELKNEIQVESSKATTVVAEGTDAGNNLDIASTTDKETGATTYTINLTDVASKTSLDATILKVDTLIADDADKSVRTIANEELAAQLLSGKADADFKTLQELAAWLEDHPESAAAMNEAIQANKTAIEKEVTDRQTAISGIQGQIDALDDTYATDDELAAVKSELEGKITAAEKKATTVVAEGTDAGNNLDIASTTDEDGATTYKINLTDVASKTTLDATITRVETNEGKLAVIQGNESVEGSIAKALKDAKDYTDAEVLEEKGAREAADAELQADIDTRATQTALDGVNGRLETVEGAYVAKVKVELNDGTVKEYIPEGNVLDLSDLVIDAGTY